MAANGFDDDQTRSFTNLAAGTIVSHYKIISKIGAGGMGEVYLAEDTQLDRKVALKFLPLHLSQDEAARARFTREAKAAAKLDHPNIVPVYEVGEFQGRPFFAMAHIEGKSLREVIKGGKQSINDAIEFTKQICEGLHEAHSAGVVHRDIKPGNIIIDKKNKPRILDFGLATVAGEDKLTKTGSTLGTVGYMSPEQIEGKKVDHRSDLFSVGVILYEMLTGRRPFEGDTDAAISNSIRNSTPEPIARYKSGTTGELQQIVDKALSKQPDVRYQHADGMLADLKRLSMGVNSSKKRRLSLWMAIAALGIIAVASYYTSTRFAVTSVSDEPGWSNSIAVLVFRDLSPDKDQDWFCEGMTEEVINRLQTIKELKTISVQSVLRFKESTSELKEIAKELSVDHVLLGSVQPDGDSIRVRISLIRAEDEVNLWNERFERERRAVFAVQDEIAGSIAEALKIELTSEQASALTRLGTDNNEAYNLYLKGRYFWNKCNYKHLKTAIDYFEQAIEQDPNYAQAYSGLADSWIQLVEFGIDSRDDEETALINALEAAEKAIEINDQFAEGYASLGAYYYYKSWYNDGNEESYKIAEENLLNAIKLNPNYAWAHSIYVMILERTGKMAEWKREVLLAHELNPLSPDIMCQLGIYYQEIGEISKEESLYDQAIELEPSFPQSYEFKSYNLADRKEFDSALMMAEKFEQYSPPSYHRPLICKARIHYYAGRYKEAEENYLKAIESAPQRWRTYYFYAQFLYSTGRYSEAKRYFEIALQYGPGIQWIHASYGSLLTYRFNMLDKGKKHILRAIKLCPSSPWPYETLAEIYDRQYNLDSALLVINKALELALRESDSLRILRQKSLIFGNFNFVDSAVAVLENALLIKSDEVGNLWLLALYCADLKNYDKADSLFQLLIQMPDSTHRSWGRRLAVYPLVYQGKIEEAIERLKDAVAVDLVETGNSEEVREKYLRVGHLCCLSENYKAALDAFEQAKRVEESLPSLIAKKSRNDLETTSLIAEMLVRTGRADSADALMEVSYSSIDPADTAALSLYKACLAGILLAKGDNDSAVALYKERLGLAEPIFMRLYNLGVAYLQAGRADEAVKALQRAAIRHDTNRLLFPEYSVLVYKYLGDAYDLAGRPDDAIKQYEIFLDYWKDADERLKLVEDTKMRLARLKESI